MVLASGEVGAQLLGIDTPYPRPQTAGDHVTRASVGRIPRPQIAGDHVTGEGVGGPHPQQEHGREAPAGELPLAVGVPRSSAFSPPFRSTRHAGGQALQRCSKKTDPLVGMMIGAG